MAKIIKTTGEIVEFLPKKGGKFTLEELQQAVGGYIELVRLRNIQHGTHLMLVNEDGKLKGLDVNWTATAFGAVDLIVGDVVLIGAKEWD